MDLGLLGHQREAETGARPCRRRSAGEPLEDGGPLLLGHADAVVVDGDLDTVDGTYCGQRISVAPPCLTALVIALSMTSRRPAGIPTISTVVDDASDTCRSG